MNAIFFFVSVATAIVFLVLFLTKKSSPPAPPATNNFREITLDFGGVNFGGQTTCVDIPIESTDRAFLISTTNWTGTPDSARLSFNPKESPSQDNLSSHVAFGLIDPTIIGFTPFTNPTNNFAGGQVYSADPRFYSLDSKFGVVFDADPLTYGGATSTMQLCLYQD